MSRLNIQKALSRRMDSTTTASVGTIFIGSVKTSKKDVENFTLHAGLIIACGLYVLGGAFCFYHLERSNEIEMREKGIKELNEAQRVLLGEWWKLTKDDTLSFEARKALSEEFLEVYVQKLFQVFENKYGGAAAEDLYINGNVTSHIWTAKNSVLLATSTLIPVGYGFVTAQTPTGRVFNVLYALVGMPLLVVTLGDMSRFVALGLVLLNHKLRELILGQNIPPHLARVPMFLVMAILVGYMFLGGCLFMFLGVGPMLDSVYFALITIFTIGFGDISPSVSYIVLIGYIVFGTVLATSCVDLVAVVAIDKIHYMGRQAQKAKIMAAKALAMANNWKMGLGHLGNMAAMARMGTGGHGGVGGVGVEADQHATLLDSLNQMAKMAKRMHDGSFMPDDFDDFEMADESDSEC